jgi:hypothetical protein
LVPPSISFEPPDAEAGAGVTSASMVLLESAADSSAGGVPEYSRSFGVAPQAVAIASSIAFLTASVSCMAGSD